MPHPIEHYVGASKDNAWIRDFLSEWQLDRKTGGSDFSVTARLRRYSEEPPDSALALIVSLAEHCSEENEKVALAEELEWLLERHGAEYWEVLNALCSAVPQFRAVMGNVWGANLPKDLKRKVEMWRS